MARSLVPARYRTHLIGEDALVTYSLRKTLNPCDRRGCVIDKRAPNPVDSTQGEVGTVSDVLASQNDDSLRPFNTLRAISSEIMRHGTPRAGGCRVDTLKTVDNTTREALRRGSAELLRVLHARAHGWTGHERVGPAAAVPALLQNQKPQRNSKTR